MDHSLLMYPTEPSSDIPRKLVIMGGRDLQQYFEDLHVLELSEDISAIHWNVSDVERPPHIGSMVCNSCCDAIESVPFHKVFTFGGKTGPMAYVNHVSVLDTGAREWSDPPVISHPTAELACEPPAPREDTAWIYDHKRSAINLFGGWSSRWLGDTWRLHAAAVIGPPYACTGIKPDIGPVFGSTMVEIHGLRLRDGNIQVKFTAGKNEAIAEGKFLDNTRISVETPNFETFGPQQVDVHVQISGEGWTVQKQRFSYYANTAGKNCLAYGPGLLETSVYGIETNFRIQVCPPFCICSVPVLRMLSFFFSAHGPEHLFIWQNQLSLRRSSALLLTSKLEAT
jgi:dynein heavy chain, axonemal